MEGMIFRKLKTISKSLLRPAGDLFFQTKTPIQVLQDSSLLDHQPDKNLTLQNNLGISEKIDDVREEQSASADDSTLNSTTLPCLKPTLTVKDQVKLKKGDEEQERHDDNDQLLLPESKELVVLYTTSLRGIRKTYEDCNAIRFLLQSFRVAFHERDVSMHLEYREELRRILGGSDRIVPPRLFVRGKYIGGADEVVGLNENGKLLSLLDGVQLRSPNLGPCNGCGGMHFLLCFRCNGSRKLASGDMESMKCPDCNENGLVKCSVCS